ncbi:zinc-dependent peptidase [Psychroserpens algicola]|uniref:Zinc-dependent peptidase n=1 Tax=Psychroserpens algicola TaxID=1719034 RepID=A0ABT0H839_9FLAO|nr:zinc-dependent peptidase [Psychroserpens algicola]MCK8480528.1 zinc-dependent peptidase [Psychroserpens algicola]
MIIALFQDQEISPTFRILGLAVFFAGMAGVVFSRFYMFFEQQYAIKYKRPFFVHLYMFKRQLKAKERHILQRKFSFYNRLNRKQKIQFEHRLATFLKDKQFLGRENLQVTTEMEVLISATAIMLTFGFRNYKIELIDKIIIYPGKYYSISNETHHKGELNPKLKALVLSWEDFLEGYDIEDDNINLGIHEFTHAIHINSLKNNDVSSLIFKRAFSELTDLLSAEALLRQKLIASKYFRPYAFTNHFEFIAVIIETFIESPDDFKQQFPRIYNKTREMLNFNYAQY